MSVESLPALVRVGVPMFTPFELPRFLWLKYPPMLPVILVVNPQSAVGRTGLIVRHIADGSHLVSRERSFDHTAPIGPFPTGADNDPLPMFRLFANTSPDMES